MAVSLIAQTAYDSYLRGKRVAVVGPAASMKGSGLGPKIDGYDVVVRINVAFPVPPSEASDIGTRLDVLYNCLNPSPECGGKLDDRALKAAGVQFVVCPLANVPPFDIDIKRWRERKPVLPFEVMDTELYNELGKALRSRPNTGFAAIWDLLHRPAAEVLVTGFTFFRGGFHKPYRSHHERTALNMMQRHGNHKQEPNGLE